jgi:hypothetical protein
MKGLGYGSQYSDTRGLEKKRTRNNMPDITEKGSKPSSAKATERRMKQQKGASTGLIRSLCPAKTPPHEGPHPNDDVDFSWDYYRKEPIFEVKETTKKGKKRIRIKIRPARKRPDSSASGLIDDIIEEIIKEIIEQLFSDHSNGEGPSDELLREILFHAVDYQDEDEREGGGGGGG